MPPNVRMALGRDVTEEDMVALWQRLVAGRTEMVTEEGWPVRVVYPGRSNVGGGPDLVDVVLRVPDGIRRGDAEIHIRSAQWWEHGHHRDPRYNNVILHIVFRHEPPVSPVLENGHTVHTLALWRFLHGIPGASGGEVRTGRLLPCQGWREDKAHLVELLDSYGEKRFQDRVSEFLVEFSRAGPGQSLYRGIMGALGYSRNRAPMEDLAERVPLASLEEIYRGRRMPADRYLVECQQRLLAKAHLLPSPAGVWHLSGVRPANHPARRILAMCNLLKRYREEGLLAGLIRPLEDIGAGWRRQGVERLLVVPGAGDIAEEMAAGGGSLLGRERAADIVVNVLLPFAVAWGRISSRPGLVAGATGLFRRYPRLAENTIERHMVRQLGIDRYLVSSARRQQGLLHLYRQRCRRGACRGCPAA